MEAFLHAHAVGLEKVAAVAAHNEKAAVGVPLKPPERLLNDILVVSARKAAVRRDNKIGVGPRRVVAFAVRAEIGAVDLARVPEDAADLVCKGIEKGTGLVKVLLRPPHFGRGDEVHRIRHLLRAPDALDMLADLLHA